MVKQLLTNLQIFLINQAVNQIKYGLRRAVKFWL